MPVDVLINNKENISGLPYVRHIFDNDKGGKTKTKTFIEITSFYMLCIMREPLVNAEVVYN